MKQHIIAALAFSIVSPVSSFAAAPELVPSGWTQTLTDKETRTRRFESPNRDSSLTTRQTRASGNSSSDIRDMASGEGERATYRASGRGWVAVSGYRNDRIFYRKANLACGGRVWNQIELEYPREQKRAMDAVVTRIARGMVRYGEDCN